jgi:membrane fusion protein (multidrug efflux system)
LVAHERARSSEEKPMTSTAPPRLAEPLETAIAAQEATAPAKAPSRKGLIATASMGLVALAAFGWYAAHRGLETTDDAQIDADVVSVPSHIGGMVAKVTFVDNQVVKMGDVLAELDAEPARAHLAQAEANLAAAVASADAADADAHVTEANARGNKSVAEASLQGAASSASATKDQIAEGEAQVASATANAQRARTDLERTKSLVASGALAQAQLDQMQAAADTTAASLLEAKAHLATLRASTTQAWSRVQEANAKVQQTSHVDVLIEQARARARAAHAQVEALKAARDLAALDVTYTRILAPSDGVVSKKTVAIGQMVSAGQPIVQLVPTKQAWVTGNLKETQLAHMHAGQSAHVTVDAYPGLVIAGEVESFSAATGARFSLLPPDNATGNFTKVVQRVPVRVRLKDVPGDVVLRPGMSVELTIDTRH